MPSDDELKEARAASLKAILDSNAHRKVIVAGPGTGKSFTFKEILKTKGGPNLALTFINNLVSDLDVAVGNLAIVRTFHAFCRGLLHSLVIEGVSQGVDYYPALGLIIVDDIGAIDEVSLETSDLEGALHNLEHGATEVTAVLRSGSYYDAVSHTDAVYRMYRHLAEHEIDIPVFDQIVVDEYQDFSLLEVSLIDLLSTRSPTLVVGDDDQALYGFKHASAIYLRGVATNPDWDRFQLPFCSRCTSVLVDATHLVIKRAQEGGLLQSRISKDFICYLPSKRVDSERFPRIIHAQCTVERNTSPLICRYVEEQIAKIPAQDIIDSRQGTDPTILIIGPKQFARRVYHHLVAIYSEVTFKESSPSEVNLLDGYLRLLKNESSRLGWRIVVFCDPFDGWKDRVMQAISQNEELAGLLPIEYRERHLGDVDLLRRYKAEEALSEEDISSLTTKLAITTSELAEALGRADEGDTPEEVPSDASEKEIQEPRITVTSLLGAKGLQAPYVFVVGLNGGHFPREATEPTEDEVCQFLVAITRATKSCTLVSCDRFGLQRLYPSIFVEWIDEWIDTRKINAAYFR